MKRLLFTARGRAELVEEPDPRPEPGRMLLRTLFSALSNGTERAQLLGLTYNKAGRYPLRPGYQAISQVVACGEGITRCAPGDIVFTGTYGTHAALHTAGDSDLLVRLPAAAELPALAFLAVAAVSWHDLALARVQPGERVLVLGAGLIGQFAVQAARLAAAEVVLASRGAVRLQAAQVAGPVRTLATTGAGDPALAASGPFAVVMDCAGADDLDTIIGGGPAGRLLARRGGRLVLVAGRERVDYDCTAAQVAALTIHHSTHFAQADLDAVLGHMLAGRLTARPFIRDLVPAAEIVRCYETLRDQPERLFGTIFDWR